MGGAIGAGSDGASGDGVMSGCRRADGVKELKMGR